MRIAIVGAESTGKTTLAAALAQALAQQTGRRVAWVAEWLREWCQHTGRTPLAHEQGSILRTQHERIEQAAATHDIVVCDTTALMTAVYSRFVFDDDSLTERAVQLHRRMSFTLLTALDLPWVADGLQRDGPQVQQPVDDLLRALLQTHGLPFAVVGGEGQARLTAALAALAPLLRADTPPAPAGSGRRTPGWLSTGTRPGSGPAAWACACCDDPPSERRLFQARRSGGLP